MGGGNVDRDAEAMRARTVRARDRTAIVGPLHRPQIREEAGPQPGELIGNFLQCCRRAVDPGEFDFFAVLARQPYDVGRVCHETGGPAVAVHLFQQRQMSHAPGIEIDGRGEPVVAQGISHREDVLDVGISEHRVEGFGALAVVDAHARAVLPDEVVIFDAVEEVGVGAEERGQGVSEGGGRGLSAAQSGRGREQEDGYDSAGQHLRIFRVVGPSRVRQRRPPPQPSPFQGEGADRVHGT
jgi:hypothetical protein